MPSALGYTKDFDESNLISSIHPNNIIIVNGQPCEVLGLYTIRAGTVMRPKNVTSLFIDYEHNSSLAIHVGRNDTKQYFGTLLADGSTGEFMLFTNADLMQSIPVYLSATTPPPLCVNHATLSRSRWRHENTISDATTIRFSDFNCRVLRKCLVAYWTLSVSL